MFGIGLGGSLQLGPQNPFLYNCANWNTTAALSRPTADMRIDTTMLDGRFVLQPTSDLSVRGGLKFNREDYRNAYLAYNPLTGQYGYVSENGAQGSVVPGESGIFDPVTAASSITRVRSLPLDMQTIEGMLGADWKLGAHDTLGATYTYTRYEPSHRERQQGRCQQHQTDLGGPRARLADLPRERHVAETDRRSLQLRSLRLHLLHRPARLRRAPRRRARAYGRCAAQVRSGEP